AEPATGAAPRPADAAGPLPSVASSPVVPPVPTVVTRETVAAATAPTSPRVEHSVARPVTVVLPAVDAAPRELPTMETVPAPSIPHAPRLVTPPGAALQIQPRPSASVVAAQAVERVPPPAVEITIGRIEVRTATPPPRPPAAARPPATSGFAAYARLRAGIDPGRR
ncbi:MAG: hypothetical protein WAS21_16320, partial [Geminicoccaceae bacterium]